DRSRGPSAICCSAHSRSSPLQSCSAPRRVDGSGALRLVAAAADVNLVLRMRHDGKTGAAQHRFCASAVGNPPVGRITGVAVLDEMELGVAGTIEPVGDPEIVIVLERLDVRAAA